MELNRQPVVIGKVIKMTLDEQLYSQRVSARVASEFERRAIRVVHATGYDLPERIQVHGSVCVDYVWERQYNEGCRFTLLHVYLKGEEVPQEQWKEVLTNVNSEIYENGNTFK